MISPIAIKGVRDGLLIHVPEGDWDEVAASLLQSVDEKGDFFRGARLAISLGEREVRAAELGRLREQLSERDIVLWAVVCDAPITNAAAADLGLHLALVPPEDRDTEEAIAFDTEVAGEEAVFVQRTLRSGHRIRHHGHVIVLGDVNPGAEIIAGGNILVWGRLRGTVHAGATGDKRAVVCALDLSPMQLRIAGHIAVSPERRGRPKPEMARLRDEQIVAETWTDAGRK